METRCWRSGRRKLLKNTRATGTVSVISSHLYTCDRERDSETVTLLYLCLRVLSSRMQAAEAELLYIKEVEKLDGFGQESFAAKV